MEEKAETKQESAKEQSGSPSAIAKPDEGKDLSLERKYARKIFWGFLIGGSVFWFLVLFVITYIFTQLVPVSGTVGGFIIVGCAAVLYLWGFVFAVLSFIAALKIKDSWAIKALYILGIILYMLVLFTGLFVLIHLAIII